MQLGLSLPLAAAQGYKNFWPGCNLGNLLLVNYHRNLGMGSNRGMGGSDREILWDLVGLDLLGLDLVGLDLGREGSKLNLKGITSHTNLRFQPRRYASECCEENIPIVSNA